MDHHRDSYELEAYDMSKASALMSREERLQMSKENELLNQSESANEEKDSGDQIQNDSIPTIVKRKKPAPPTGGPQPRWHSPSRDDYGSSDEEKSPERNGIKTVKKRGVSIDDMIDEPILSVNLDDDSDEEEKVDFKVFSYLFISSCYSCFILCWIIL